MDVKILAVCIFLVCIVSATVEPPPFIPSGPRPNGLLPSGPTTRGPRPSGPLPSGPKTSGPRPSGLLPNGPTPSGPRPNELLPDGLRPGGPISCEERKKRISALDSEKMLYVLLPALPGIRERFPSLIPPPGLWTPCGNVGNRCKCNGEVADCSGNVKSCNLTNGYRKIEQTECSNLTFIPKFTQTITTLLFRENRLQSIDANDFFANVSQINRLDLSFNFIKCVKRGVFTNLKNLKVLGFSGNELKFDDMIKALATPSLQELDISHSPGSRPLVFGGDIYLRLIDNPPLSKLTKYRMPNLTKLWINYFELPILDLKHFRYLKNLRELSVRGAQTLEVLPGPMPSLEKLFLRDNLIHEFIPTCYRSMNPGNWDIKPTKLSFLDLDGNNIRYFAEKEWPTVCLSHLTHLRLSMNIFREINGSMFSIIHFPELQHLSLKRAGRLATAVYGVITNPSLLTIDFSDNVLDFSSDAVNVDIFRNCTGLMELNLEGNYFMGIPEAKFTRLFSTLENLHFVNLGNTKLAVVNRTLLETLTNVSKMYLNDNKLTNIPDGTFDNVRNLTTLRLDGNLITTISESTFSSDTRIRLQSLNLSNNPFECACSLLWFRQWLTSNKELFDYNNPYSRYGCKNIPGKDVVSFLLHEQQCLLSHETYVFTVVCTAMLILTLTLVTVFYRYRWHIRLVLYEAFRGNPQARWRQHRPEHFQYDLFVSYDSEDERWVTEHLMPALETDMGLRLCVHQRDFIPGKNITDNIVDCLEVSKRVLAVFSPNFAESQWCQFELEMCLSHVVENDDVMVVVILQHVPARDMSGAMKALMKTTTYIEWGSEPEAVYSFWRRMTLALADILPALRQ